MNSISYALQRYLKAELAIEESARHGYSHWYLDASLMTDLPETWNECRISRLLERMLSLRCEPIVHGNFRLPIASESLRVRTAAVEEVVQEIKLAKQMAAPLIIHGGAIIEPRKVVSAKSEALARLIDSLRVICREAASMGVEVCLENLSAHRTHPFYYLCTLADEFEHVLTEVPELRVFFDIGHANVHSDDVMRFLKLVQPRLSGVSLSDNNGTRDSHGPLGSGTVPITEIFAHLSATNWRGFVGLEVRGTNPSDDLCRAQALMGLPPKR